MFFDSILQEYKLAFSTLKSANTPSEVVLLRIIHDCAAEYYESLVHLNGRQLPAISNQFFELKSDFYGVSVFPEDYLNLGFNNSNRFNFSDFQSPLQDEWFTIKSFESIINKNSSIFVGQLQKPQELNMLATSFMSVIGTRLKALFDSSQLDLEKEFFPNIRRNVKLVPFIRAELVDSYSKQVVFFVKSFIDSLNHVMDLNQLILHFAPHSKRKSTQTKDFLDSILLLFLLPFKSAAAEKSQHVDQLIPVEIRLLLFPIIYEMFSKKHYRPTGLEDLDLYKHVLVTNFFKPCFYQPFLPTITIPNKLKLIIQPVLVSAKKSSDWSLASDDIDVVIDQFFVQANQSSFDFDELFDEKYLAPKKAKKRKRNQKIRIRMENHLLF